MQLSNFDSGAVLKIAADLFKEAPKNYLANGLPFMLIDYQQLKPREIPEHNVPFYVVEIINSRVECPFEYTIGDDYDTPTLHGYNVSFYPSNISYKSSWEKELYEVCLFAIDSKFFELFFKKQCGVDRIDLSFKKLSNDIYHNPVFRHIYHDLRPGMSRIGGCSDRYDYQKSILDAIVYALCYELSPDPQSYISDEQLVVDKAKELIQRNWLDENFRLDNLPKMVEYELKRPDLKLSRSKLERWFKEYELKTPAKFIDQLRLDYIYRRLLHYPTEKQIMTEIGCEHISNFRRLFYRLRNSNKITPKEMITYFRFLDQNRDLLEDVNISAEQIRNKGEFRSVEDLNEVMLIKFNRDLNQFRQTITGDHKND